MKNRRGILYFIAIFFVILPLGGLVHAAGKVAPPPATLVKKNIIYLNPATGKKYTINTSNAFSVLQKQAVLISQKTLDSLKSGKATSAVQNLLKKYSGQFVKTTADKKRIWYIQPKSFKMIFLENSPKSFDYWSTNINSKTSAGPVAKAPAPLSSPSAAQPSTGTKSGGSNNNQQTDTSIVVSKVYVNDNDIFIEGNDFLRVTSSTIENSTCVYYGNDAGFAESYGQKEIKLTGYARCLPSTKPNYISLSWNKSDHSGKGEKKFLIEE